MRRFGLHAVLVAVLMALFVDTAPAADTFEIPVILPLTGGAAFLGKAEQQALIQLEKTIAATGGIHGRELRFVFHDDQTNPQTTVQLAAQIIASNPPIVLGPAITASCNAMAPLMKRGPVMYCFSPGIHPAPGSFVFSSSASTRDLASSLLRYFRYRGWSKIALITSADASGQDAVTQIRAMLSQPGNRNLKVVSETTFNPTDISVAAQIQRMKSAKPDALIVWCVGAPLATVLKGIVDANFDVPVATSDGNMTYAQMTQYAKFLPKQFYVMSPEWVPSTRASIPQKVKAAKEEFFNAFHGTKIRPDAASTYAWDPAMIVVTALRELAPNVTARQLRNYIAKLHGFAGINGVYDFPKSPQRGLDDSNVVVTRWSPSANTWVVVSEPRGKPKAP